MRSNVPRALFARYCRLQVRGRFENDAPASRDYGRGAGLWITPSALPLLKNSELAKIIQGHVLSSRENGSDFVQHLANQCFGFVTGKPQTA